MIAVNAPASSPPDVLQPLPLQISAEAILGTWGASVAFCLNHVVCTPCPPTSETSQLRRRTDEQLRIEARVEGRVDRVVVAVIQLEPGGAVANQIGDGELGAVID